MRDPTLGTPSNTSSLSLEESEDGVIFPSPSEPDTFVLDPILFITSPIFGSILSLNPKSPLCDFDDLLRLASQQTAQEITDSVNQLEPWRVTKREVQGLIQMGIKRVAKSRDVKAKVVARELEEAKRENGVVARERGRKRRDSDEVVRQFIPAGIVRDEEEEEEEAE